MWRRLDSFLVRPRRKKFRAGFVVGEMEMGIYFGSVPFSPPPPLPPSPSPPPPFCMLGNFLSFFRLCPWIEAVGTAVFSGMAGYVVIVSMEKVTPGLPLLVTWR